MRRYLLFILAISMLFSSAALADDYSPVRLRVIADSDEEYAQNVKLIVRDAVVGKARELIGGATDSDSAYAILLENADDLRIAARRAARGAGFQSDVRVTVGECEFPAKIYSNTLLDSGVYRSVIVELGEAEGHNWWCVIYPSLCYFEEPDTENGEVVFYSGVLTWLYDFLYGGDGR